MGSDMKPTLALTFFSNKGQTPGEHVHEVWQPVWVGRTVELSDVHNIVLIFENGSLVVVYVEVVGSREDGHDRWETCRLGFAVHPVAVRRNEARQGVGKYGAQRLMCPSSCSPCILCLVGANDGQQIVALEELTCCLVCEEIRASSDVVVNEALICLFGAKVFKGICP